MSDFTPGQPVTWMYTHARGWNETRPVRAEIVKVNSKTITIKAFMATGGFVTRHVKPESLRVKS